MKKLFWGYFQNIKDHTKSYWSFISGFLCITWMFSLHVIGFISFFHLKEKKDMVVVAIVLLFQSYIQLVPYAIIFAIFNILLMIVLFFKKVENFKKEILIGIVITVFLLLSTIPIFYVYKIIRMTELGNLLR